MPYTLEIRPTAERDIRQRYRQIALESPQNAYTWYCGIMQSIESLAHMPERCPLAAEDLAFHIGIRHLISGNYRVLFLIENHTVIILHIRHSAMDRVL